jgi:hypothetical protein
VLGKIDSICPQNSPYRLLYSSTEWSLKNTTFFFGIVLKEICILPQKIRIEYHILGQLIPNRIQYSSEE